MASRSMLMSTTRFVLVLLSRAVQDIILTCESIDTQNKSFSENAFVSAKIHAVIAKLKGDGTLMEWFSKLSLPEKVKNHYSDNLASFLKRPVFDSREIQDLYHMLARPPTPDHSSQDQTLKETLRNLRVLQDKRKRELADAITR